MLSARCRPKDGFSCTADCMESVSSHDYDSITHLNLCFRNDGIGVDVHVHRISNLLGWHKPPTKTPEQTRYVSKTIFVYMFFEGLKIAAL